MVIYTSIPAESCRATTPKPVIGSSSDDWPKDAIRAKAVDEADALVARADLVEALVEDLVEDLVATAVNGPEAEDPEVIEAGALVVDLADQAAEPDRVVGQAADAGLVAVAVVADSAAALAWNTPLRSWRTEKFTSRRLEVNFMWSMRHRRWNSKEPIS
jgi:hypothetical protein